MMIKDIDKLIGIDLETTGSSFSDRIVEFAITTYENGELTDTFVERVNPGISIPKAVVEIHGISDEDVKDKPDFGAFAPKIIEIIKNSAIFGYNVIFDFNVLSHEMVRFGYPFLDPKKWVLLDPFAIWKKMEPKSLTHAYKFFCGKELEGAHGALADIKATYEVMAAQLEKYQELPKNVNELGNYCYPKDDSWVCSSYHFIWSDKGDIICNFGKNKRKPLSELVSKQRSFCEWILDKEFPEDVKDLVRRAINGEKLPEK